MKMKLSFKGIMLKSVLLFTLSGLALTLSGCVDKAGLKAESLSSSEAVAASAPSASIEGSDVVTWNVSTSTLPLALKISEDLKSQQLGNFEVMAVGKNAAIEALTTETKSLALFEGVSDSTGGLTLFPLGYEAVALIVNPNSPLTSLSHEEIVSLFSGEIDQVNGTAVSLVVGAKDNAARLALEDIYGLKGDVNGMVRSLIPDTAIMKDSDAEVLAEVQASLNSIGVVALNQISADIKTLAINGVDATSENILNGTYSGARVIQLATTDATSDSLMIIKTWAESEIGKNILKEMNIVN